MRKQILLVEDEKHLAEALAHNLEFEGYRVSVARDGEQALRMAEGARFDLIILDIMLPKIDGLEVCRRLRTAGSKVPILFLTAKADHVHRIEGLKAGADDYIAKPFLLEELILRIKNIFRRQEWYATGSTEQEVLRFGNNEVNFHTFKAVASGKEIELTEKECMLMKLFAERPNQVISREEILERVWGYKGTISSRTLDNYVSRLRKYFEPNPRRPIYFRSIRGVGYKFTPDAG